MWSFVAACGAADRAYGNASVPVTARSAIKTRRNPGSHAVRVRPSREHGPLAVSGVVAGTVETAFPVGILRLVLNRRRRVVDLDVAGCLADAVRSGVAARRLIRRGVGGGNRRCGDRRHGSCRQEHWCEVLLSVLHVSRIQYPEPISSRRTPISPSCQLGYSDFGWWETVLGASRDDISQLKRNSW